MHEWNTFDDKVIPILSYCEAHQCCEVTPVLSLLVQEESLDALDDSKEADLQFLPHPVQRLNLQWQHKTHTALRTVSSEDKPINSTKYNVNQDTLMQERPPHIQDGLPAAHVYLKFSQCVL